MLRLYHFFGYERSKLPPDNITNKKWDKPMIDDADGDYFDHSNDETYQPLEEYQSNSDKPGITDTDKRTRNTLRLQNFHWDRA